MQKFNRTILTAVKNMQHLLLKPRASAALLFGIVMSSAAIFSTIYPILAVILSISTVILLFFILKTELSYYLLIILLNLSSIGFFKVIHQKLYLYPLGDLFILIVFLLWGFSRAANLAKSYSKTPCDIPLLLFVGLSILSLLWADDYKSWMYQFLRLSFGLGAFLVTILLINNHKILNTAIWIIIIMGVLNSIICFVSIYTYPDYTHIKLFESKYANFVIFFNDTSVVGKRGHAFAHPLTTAYWLNFALILSFGKVITIQGYKKLVLCFLMFLMLTAHLTTLSKTPLLALIAGLIFFFYSYKPIRRVFFISVGVLIVVIGVSFILANITDLENSTRYTYNQLTGYNEYSSSTSRMDWWTTSVKKSLESYGLGVGLGGTPKYLTPIKIPHSHINAPHSHNVWVNTFGDLGFIGLGLLVLIYFFAFKSYVAALRQCKNEYYKRILLSYISGFVIMLLFILTDYDYTATILWWYMGLGFAIARLATEATPEYRGLKFV